MGRLTGACGMGFVGDQAECDSKSQRWKESRKWKLDVFIHSQWWDGSHRRLKYSELLDWIGEDLMGAASFDSEVSPKDQHYASDTTNDAACIRS